jgi:hypothetical protein
LNLENVKVINEIPVLFPCSNSDSFWTINKNYLEFEDDLLKSAFYLLSGYQEYTHHLRDASGRFSAKDSVQYKLGIIHKPVVNYYFDEIRKGIQAFLSMEKIRVEKKSMFNPFCFLLTHDVDRVHYYSGSFLIYKLKEIAGIRATKAKHRILIKQFLSGLAAWLSFDRKSDPAWNFDYLRNLEAANNLQSVFYFLDNETLHVDADYSFTDERIKDLINSLHQQGCEIGLHGSHNSATRKGSLLSNKLELGKVFPHKVTGIRQHRLRYEIPITAVIQQECGFTYDTSLGFFDYEGFRNSCCTPFKLYDFSQNKMLGIWEIPLNVMDCTLLEYRELKFGDALERVNILLDEISRFSGVFTLLWHNGYFDEVKFPGIHQFYEEIISNIVKRKPINSTGNGIIDQLASMT